MNRVNAIREDAVVGSHSGSSVNECLTDSELLELLNEDGIESEHDAVSWARDKELLYLEVGLNTRWGEDGDPQLNEDLSFKQSVEDNPISV